MGGDKSGILQAGLPNIEGESGNAGVTIDFGVGSGAFYTESANNSFTTGNFKQLKLCFDASRSNPIYGASTTVQPPSIQLLPQIKY